MTIEELQILFRANLLIEAVAEPFSAEHAQWIVECRHIQGDVIVITDSKGEERHYRDLKHASECVKQIGFSQLRVEQW